MKRGLSALTALLLALTLAACGGSSGGNKAADRAEALPATAAARQEAEYDGYMKAPVNGEIADGEAPAGAGEMTGGKLTGGQQAASTQAKIIRTQNYSLETTEFEAALEVLKTRPAQFGGYIESSEQGANSRGLHWVNMVIRVPSGQLDAFAEGMTENCQITHFSESTENVTLKYVDLESHIKALRTEQEALLAMLEKADDVDSMIYIQSHLTDVRYQIESYESQLRVLADEVDYSTVNLSLAEVVREQNTDKSFFGEAGAELSDNLYRIGQGIRNFGIWVIGHIPQFIFLAVFIAVIVMVVKRVKRRAAGKANAKDEQAG